MARKKRTELAQITFIRLYTVILGPHPPVNIQCITPSPCGPKLMHHSGLKATPNLKRAMWQFVAENGK